MTAAPFSYDGPMIAGDLMDAFATAEIVEGARVELRSRYYGRRGLRALSEAAANATIDLFPELMLEIVLDAPRVILRTKGYGAEDLSDVLGQIPEADFRSGPAQRYGEMLSRVARRLDRVD